MVLESVQLQQFKKKTKRGINIILGLSDPYQWLLAVCHLIVWDLPDLA
jgi:hypothetical protein